MSTEPCPYTITVQWQPYEDEPGGYYFVWHPEFGYCACSATGDTLEEAISNLHRTREFVIEYYAECGRPIPAPLPRAGEPTPLDVAIEESQELLSLKDPEG
jgi:predicted RNase H-like HicB family nuclease